MDLDRLRSRVYKGKSHEKQEAHTHFVKVAWKKIRSTQNDLYLKICTPLCQAEFLLQILQTSV